MKGSGCILLAVGALLLFLLVFATTPTVSFLILDIFYIHQISWVLLLSAIVTAIIAIVLGSNYNTEDQWPPYAIAAIILTVIWFFWLGIQNPIKMAALSSHTQYAESALLPQSGIRPVAYSVASANINSSKSDPRSAAGDLDYVQDHWIASIDPSGFWVSFSRPTQGIFVFNDEYKVEQRIQPFTFAEAGMLWNSATHIIRKHEYFVEFSDVLYVQQTDGKYLAVSTLIKRAGFARYPYIYGVAVISSDGFVEILPTETAEADPRLAGIQLVPFSFESERAYAAGWRHGWVSGIFSRTDRLVIQTSVVNFENAAPFHLKGMNGNVWYTPLAPIGSSSESIVAIAMSDSHDVNGPVYIWRLPVNTAIPSADFLASVIESAPNHSNIVWFRSGGESKCGNVAILEMVPIVRNEVTGPHLYFMGYVSAAPISSNVKFYSIIDPASMTVYEDLPTYDHVNRWLRGEFELVSVSQNSTAIDPITGQCLTPETIKQAPDQEIINYLRLITEELDRRLGQ